MTKNRIALTNLAAYNSGTLRFTWLDLPYTTEEFTEAIKTIGSPEEYCVSDYETEFPGLQTGAYPDFESLNAFFEEYETLDTWEQNTLKALTGIVSPYEALDIFNGGAYVYYHEMSLADVAGELVDEGCFGNVPEDIKNYIDYDAIGYALSNDGYTETSNGVVRID